MTYKKVIAGNKEYRVDTEEYLDILTGRLQAPSHASKRKPDSKDYIEVHDGVELKILGGFILEQYRCSLGSRSATENHRLDHSKRWVLKKPHFEG